MKNTENNRNWDRGLQQWMKHVELANGERLEQSKTTNTSSSSSNLSTELQIPLSTSIEVRNNKNNNIK